MERLQPLIAGLVTAVVGFASSFAVVLAGLRAAGADERQAASGLMALCVSVGVVAILLGLWLRMPISIAWSTPGAALLLTTPNTDFAAAVGAFVVCGVLIVLAGFFPPLGRLIGAIPKPIASAMLGGVLLKLCLAPVAGLTQAPLLTVPVILVWALLYRVARTLAVPGALVAAIAAIALTTEGLGTLDPWPPVEFTAPVFDLAAVAGIGVPLFLVTMASQNVPGMAVLSGFGYHPPLRPVLLATGAASVAGAAFGGHAINLAAITAALAAGPDASPDPGRRWIASVTAGASMIVLGLLSGLAAALIVLSPPVLIEAVAGLALLGAMSNAVLEGFRQAEGREAAVVTFVVTFSGLSYLGIGSAFWGLLAGGLMHLLLRPQPASEPASPRERVTRATESE
ncbi:benzoate/H(+) symporter BenE family transporter [Nonomuraea sp. NPDC050310]|uniref:benzoate/H(+) symporter BenE family transporter n=1 Tax=Nonomuraea sp. NPDC050310 TaxID=3154935 RepID=UPI0033C8C3DD